MDNKFVKIGENHHGPICSVINDELGTVGSVEKWHGLFICRDTDGDKIGVPFSSRKEAAADLVESFKFNAAPWWQA